MKIYKNIYMVASGHSGFSISNEYDCNVYLIDCGHINGEHQCILIDAGMGIDIYSIEENIKDDGFSMKDIKKIILTHGHGDHCGGANALKELTGADVYALSPACDFVKNSDIEKMSLQGAINSGIFSADYQFIGCNVEKLDDNEVIELGKVRLMVIRTEGHCDGHASYLMEIDGKRILFSGDSVFTQGKISIQAIWDCDLKKYIKTCRELDNLNIDILLPSHGAIALKDGDKHIKMAVDEINNLRIPKNN